MLGAYLSHLDAFLLVDTVIPEKVFAEFIEPDLLKMNTGDFALSDLTLTLLHYFLSDHSFVAS